MYRITLRFSLDGDKGSAVRNQMVSPLKAAGFENVKTGTWEAYGANSHELCDAATKALHIAENSGKLDHYWLHIEKFSLRQAPKLLKAAKALNPR